RSRAGRLEMSPFRRTTILRHTRTSFALAVVTLLAWSALSNSAQAGCGDYVFVRDSSGKLVRASDLIDGHRDCAGPDCPDYHSSAAELASTPLSPAEPAPIKVPCNGPNCSSRSECPVAPTVPAAPPSVREST